MLPRRAATRGRTGRDLFLCPCDHMGASPSRCLRLCGIIQRGSGDLCPDGPPEATSSCRRSGGRAWDLAGRRTAVGPMPQHDSVPPLARSSPLEPRVERTDEDGCVRVKGHDDRTRTSDDQSTWAGNDLPPQGISAQPVTTEVGWSCEGGPCIPAAYSLPPCSCTTARTRSSTSGPDGSISNPVMSSAKSWFLRHALGDDRGEVRSGRSVEKAPEPDDGRLQCDVDQQSESDLFVRDLPGR